MSKIKIAASFFYVPSQKLRDEIDSAREIHISNGVGPRVEEAAKTDKWIEDHFIFDKDFEDNIISKNKQYCELTTLYLLWKN